MKYKIMQNCGRNFSNCSIYAVCQFRTVAVGSSTSSATTSVSETPSTSSTTNQSRSTFAANAIAQARAAAQMSYTTDPPMAGSMDHYSTAEVFIFIADTFNRWAYLTVIKV